jgi:hypothetical protein
VVLLGVCFFGVLVLGQAASKPRPPQSSKTLPPTEAAATKSVDGHLVRVQTITTPSEMVTWFYSPLRCDNDGNLYLPLEVTDMPAIRKLNQKGERVALYEANKAPDFKVDLAPWYAVDPEGGDLYLLAEPHELSRYVFAYKSDGTFKSAVKLQPGFPFFPTRIAVFPSGQFLIAGEEYDADRTAVMWPFTGIFSSDGRLLKELELEDDKTLRNMAASGDTRVTLPENPQANLAINYGSLEMGNDGNGYLMRWTNPTVFYAISAGGQVVRRFTVDPGDSGYRPRGFHIAKNRIAIFFWDKQSNDTLMKVVDLEGHEIATYDEPKGARAGNSGLGLSFACYTENPTRFMFLGADDDRRLQFWIAEPR